MKCEIYNQDCVEFLRSYTNNDINLTFLDPPFNQGKDYRNHDDKMSEDAYWDWMKTVCDLVYKKSSEGASIYFMQREKNVDHVLSALESTGWTFQNLIVWKKLSSAVPNTYRFGKNYQIIAFFTKGERPYVFNHLRIDPPLLVTQKYKRTNGLYVTDVWEDIREMTSGYFAGDEPLRDSSGNRFHNQQSPIHLLLRIILSSTKINDIVFDPFAGTGTTLLTAYQLKRNSFGTEIDPINVERIKERLSILRPSDNVEQYRNYYRFTENLDSIWPIFVNDEDSKFDTLQPKLIN